MLEQKISNMENKETRYSYSKNGVDYSICCKEISNGYVLRIYKNWYEGEGDKKEWKSEEKETYYKENPLDEKSEKEEVKDDKSVLKSLSSFMEKINPLING